MSGKTAISWTDRVWNPVTRCSKVSEGCRNWYAENQQNTPAHADAKSRYRGVSWSKCRSKWWARIHIAGQSRSLGFFTSEIEAAEAARLARIETMPYAVD
jgi:protein gp37